VTGQATETARASAQRLDISHDAARQAVSKLRRSYRRLILEEAARLDMTREEFLELVGRKAS